MREIKFKAKRIDTGEWVFGFLVVDECGTWMLPDSGDLYDIVYHFRNDEDHYKPFEVDPATVCEFTGLNDMNGVDIYEGDVVLIGACGPYYPKGLGTFVFTEWKHGSTQGGYGWMSNKAGWSLESDCAQVWTNQTIEVTGNIHDSEEEHDKDSYE